MEIAVVAAPGSGADLTSPLAALPSGASFGSLVHAVLETADPAAPDLAAELEAQVRRHAPWWTVDVDHAQLAPELARALLPMHDTPLGPAAAALTLRQIGVRDRLRELDFEMPLAGAICAAGPRTCRWPTWVSCWRRTCPATTRCRPTPIGLVRPGWVINRCVATWRVDRRGAAATRAAISGGRLQDQSPW